jgi:hypothetical protein
MTGDTATSDVDGNLDGLAEERRTALETLRDLVQGLVRRSGDAALSHAHL